MTRQAVPLLALFALVGSIGTRAAAASKLPSVATLEPTLELRHIGDLVVPLQSGMPVPTYEPQLRPRIDLSQGWRMWRTELDHTLSLSARTPGNLFSLEREGRGAHKVDLDDGGWEMTRLPVLINPLRGRYPSGVWYRRRVGIPPLWRGRRVLLHCLAANYIADVWVNGQHVGYHEGGFTPFSFDITEQVKWGTGNLLAIRVDNPPWLGSAASGLASQEIVPYGPGDWWNATGVLRDIYLEALPAAALMRADVKSEATEKGTQLEVAVVLRNAGADTFGGELAAQVCPAKVGQANLTTPGADAIAGVRHPVAVLTGKPSLDFVIAGETVLAWELKFTTQKLRAWSPKEPNLYVLEVLLRDDEGKIVDRLMTQFGMRSLAVDAGQGRLLLNGQPTVLAGLARVEDDPQLGRAMTFRDGLRVLLDLRTAKWASADFLRLGHFVNHPITTILADRVGLVCWEEIPVLGFDARGLAIQWERRRIARQMFVEMIYQDYNRPSVGFWGTCHDTGWGEAHLRYLRDLADISRYLDGTRLVGQSASAASLSPAHAECDVQGYALSVTSYPSPALQAETLAALDRMHAAFPHKPVIITEFGVEAGEDAATWRRQARAAQELVRAFGARPFVAGCAWWSLADFQGDEGVRETGLVSRDRRTVRPVLGALREEYQRLRER